MYTLFRAEELSLHSFLERNRYVCTYFLKRNRGCAGNTLDSNLERKVIISVGDLEMLDGRRSLTHAVT